MIKKILLSTIIWYKKAQPLRVLTGSHLLLFGGDCKFIPTCSEYSYQAIQKYGILKGSFLGLKRILKCNPFSNGGVDPL